MRFVACMFLTSVLSAGIGFASSYAAYRSAEDRMVAAEHKLIIAKWDVDRLTDEVARHKERLALDAARRAQRDPVNPRGPVVPAGDRIPAPQVPFPVAPLVPSIEPAGVTR